MAVNSDNLTRSAGTYINITDEGNLSLGITKAEPNAIFEAYSNSKGILIPRMSKIQRNNIATPIENGLLIFNTDENCINYFDNNWDNWRSLCGTYPPAKIDLVDCKLPEPRPYLIQGEPLTGNNDYVVRISVSEVGTYEMTAKTTNGYSYVKTGVFNETGTYSLHLDGQGIPYNPNPNPGDAITLLLNGVDITPQNPEASCTRVKVDNSVTTYTLDCDSVKEFGTYKKGEAVNSSHYITVDINVFTGGQLNIETNTVNGIKFSSGSITVTGSPEGTTNTIKLYASGTPLNVTSATNPNYQYNITNLSTLQSGDTSCTFGIAVTSDLGTFNNPATSCDAIFNEFNTTNQTQDQFVAKDGLYWIGQSNNKKYKTQCDMVDSSEAAEFGKEVGGYTLLWTTSENIAKINNWYSNGGYMSLANGWGRNVVTAENGVFNVNDFRIPADVRINWNNKPTRFIVTDDPSIIGGGPSIKNLLNLNIVSSNIITTTRDLNNMSKFAGVEIMKGHYMGKPARLVKNASGDRTTIYVNDEIIINTAYLYSHDGYPFHYDLTTYGYYPIGFLGVPSSQVILDGNWPTWVAGEYEGITGQEPFGNCDVQTITSTSKFWGGSQVAPVVSNIPACIYNNANTKVTPNTNGVEGRVMQWWAK